MYSFILLLNIREKKLKTTGHFCKILADVVVHILQRYNENKILFIVCLDTLCDYVSYHRHLFLQKYTDI